MTDVASTERLAASDGERISRLERLLDRLCSALARKHLKTEGLLSFEDEIECLRRELAILPAGGEVWIESEATHEWQRIDNAPKNGIIVDLLTAHGAFFRNCRWTANGWTHLSYRGDDWVAIQDDYCGGLSHWMLPQKPRVAAPELKPPICRGPSAKSP